MNKGLRDCSRTELWWATCITRTLLPEVGSQLKRACFKPKRGLVGVNRKLETCNNGRFMLYLFRALLPGAGSAPG
jgi:hypothetical protein